MTRYLVTLTSDEECVTHEVEWTPEIAAAVSALCQDINAVSGPKSAHEWKPGYCLGPIQLCQRCPVVWWQWHDPKEPSEPCVPIEDVSFDYAGPQGEVA